MPSCHLRTATGYLPGQTSGRVGVHVGSLGYNWAVSCDIYRESGSLGMFGGRLPQRPVHDPAYPALTSRCACACALAWTCACTCACAGAGACAPSVRMVPSGCAVPSCVREHYMCLRSGMMRVPGRARGVSSSWDISCVAHPVRGVVFRQEEQLHEHRILVEFRFLIW